MQALFLTTDLLFSSRVSSLARQAGVTLVVRGSLDTEILDDTGNLDEEIRLVFIDLGLRGLDVAEVLNRLRSGSIKRRIIAYGPHVDAALLATANAAGCDIVMPRSQFDQQIGTILSELAMQG